MYFYFEFVMHIILVVPVLVISPSLCVDYGWYCFSASQVLTYFIPSDHLQSRCHSP